MPPIDIIRTLSDAPLDQLAAAARRARTEGRTAWLTISVAVGIAQERSRRGEHTLERLSAAFELHRSRIARLGQIFRGVLQPLVSLGYDPILRERSWYDTALEAGGRRRIDPIALYLEAERRHTADPAWTCRAWRRELGLDATRAASGPLSDLVEMDPAVVAAAIAPDDLVEAEHWTACLLAAIRARTA